MEWVVATFVAMVWLYRLGQVLDRVRLVTSHCDPTVNLYDYMFPVQDGMVREIWPIAARGASY